MASALTRFFQSFEAVKVVEKFGKGPTLPHFSIDVEDVIAQRAEHHLWWLPIRRGSGCNGEATALDIIALNDNETFRCHMAAPSCT